MPPEHKTSSHPRVAEALRRARLSKGKSQGDLAAEAGISRAWYRSIETGEAQPRLDTLAFIAQALDTSVDQLLRPQRELHAVRFRATKKMTTRRELLSDVARWLDDYEEMERLTNDQSVSPLENVRSQLSGAKRGDRPKEGARIAREAFGLEREEPIRDVVGLLESHGIKVWTTSVASDAFFGLSVAEGDGGPAVVVNTWDRLTVERWIFSAFHELGHLVLHLDAFDADVTDEIEAQEKEANMFASHFLMPDDLFRKEWSAHSGLPFDLRVLKLKRIFHVSWQTVLMRVAPEHGNQSAWARFQGMYRQRTGKTLRRKEEPQRLVPEDFISRRLPGLVRRAVVEEKILPERAREILRLDEEEMTRLLESWKADGSERPGLHRTKPRRPRGSKQTA